MLSNCSCGSLGGGIVAVYVEAGFGYTAATVATFEEEVPEVFGRLDSAGKPAGHSTDSNRLKFCVCRRRGAGDTATDAICAITITIYTISVTICTVTATVYAIAVPVYAITVTIGFAICAVGITTCAISMVFCVTRAVGGVGASVYIVKLWHLP